MSKHDSIAFDRNRLDSCFRHFGKRLRERVSPDLDTGVIWKGIRKAIERGDTQYVRFVARTNRRGRRLWRVCGGEGCRAFFIIYDHELGCPVTVLPEDARVLRTSRKGRSREIRLGRLA